MYTSLKHAFRILFRYRLYTLFAWLGLSIAVSSVWFIAQYVQQTQSFDAFHPEPEVIYRVTMEVAAGSETEHYATTGLPLGEQLQAQYPGVMAYARLTFRPGVIRHQDATFQESGVYTANSETFQVFGFDWLEGSTPSPLAAPNSLVLTESLAQKYFPTTQAVGQTLMVDDEEYTVAGVFRDWPGTSHLEVQALLAAPAMAYDAQSWFDLESYTYLRLNPSSTHTQLNEQLQLLQERELVPIMEGSGLQAELYAQPLPEVYFSSGLTYDVPKGNRAYVYALTGAGWLIFLVAALNFVNLNLTRSTQRTKEILVKKTLGMSPRQLWWQSGYESLGVTLLVVILAGVLVLLLRPYYESFTGLPMAPFQSMASLAALLVVSLLGLGLLGSGYSGTYLSFQRPTLSHISTQRPLLKHLLLGFQYTLAVILLVITLGMGRQLDYMRQKDMGFAQEQIMLVSLPEGEEETHSRIGELRDQLASTAIISQVALAGGGALPGEDNGKELFEIKSEGGIIEKVYNIYAIDDQYLPTLSIPLAEGRNFDPDRISDRNGAVLINEALAKALGWESPLGQQINCYGDWREVVGVVKDFHHQSLHNPIEPVVFLYDVSYASTLLVKAPLAATPLLESTFRTHFPDTPYTLSYFYQFIGALYQQEQRLSVLFRFFSMVALLLCGMGLFALFSLQVHQRTRELGIRKVLGARARHLLQNLFKSYRYTALIALAVGLPLAGWWIQVWLQDFSYRVTLGSSIYLMAIVWIIGVSLAVTSYHILKALRANPVESLKQE